MNDLNCLPSALARGSLSPREIALAFKEDGQPLHALGRIHYVESELDHPIAAISSPAEEGPQEKPENFMEEFSVGVEGRQKAK